MRIIEPKIEHKKIKKSYKASKLFWVLASLSLMIVLILVLSGIAKAPKVTNQVQKNSDNKGTTEASANLEIKQFTNQQFHEIYLSSTQPNTQEIVTLPYITGNIDADKRIQKIAEARGYFKSRTPVSPIVKLDETVLEGDDLLQEKSASAWKELKKSANTNGINLTITSAYRSFDFQRQLFLSRLYARGVGASQIAAGNADSAVEATLSVTAPPGYSRHHTGYTIDLACGNVGLQAFASTKCYKWLSQNNLANTKMFGWIPSYPEATGTQGPEPEAWEFVWVGKSILSK